MSNGSTANTRQPDEEGALPSNTSILFDFSGLTDRQVKYVTTRPERVLRPWLKNLPNGRSGWADMWCPLHEDPETSKKASAGVNFIEHCWNCQSVNCDAGGDLNFLLLNMAERRVRVPDQPLKKLKRKKPEKLPSPGDVHGWHDHLMDAISVRAERAREYLRRVRFWDDDTLRELMVGYRSDRDLLTFPVYVDGELVNVRYRAVGPGCDMFGVMGGTTKRLYPHDIFMEDMRDPVVVCEGEMDLGMARSEGFNAVTSNTGASRAFVDVVQEHAEAFRGRAVVVALDAGAEQVSQAVVDVLEAAGAHATGLQWPDDKPDGYDLTDARKELGDKFAPRLRKLLGVERPIVVTGGEFILDEPEGVPSVWGDDGNRVLWAEGEGFMLVGPQGVGKTTLAQQIALRKIGLGAKLLLDIPIKPAEGKVLYLAMDRPRQAARSFRRMVRKEDREILDERLVIHRGPLSFDPTEDEKGLWELMKEHGCVYVIVDSLKDYASSLTDDGIAIKSNRSFQWVISHGGEVLIIHHQRKANNDNRKPDKLDDVYGSTWHTSGMGSVVLLWGTPGSHDVELRHLKQPAEPVGPLRLTHDHATGTIALSTAREDEEMALLDALQAEPDDGLDLIALTESLGRDASEKKEREATRRRLEALVKKGDLQMLPGQRGGKKGSNQTRWKLL